MDTETDSETSTVDDELTARMVVIEQAITDRAEFAVNELRRDADAALRQLVADRFGPYVTTEAVARITSDLLRSVTAANPNDQNTALESCRKSVITAMVHGIAAIVQEVHQTEASTEKGTPTASTKAASEASGEKRGGVKRVGE